MNLLHAVDSRAKATAHRNLDALQYLWKRIDPRYPSEVIPAERIEADFEKVKPWERTDLVTVAGELAAVARELQRLGRRKLVDVATNTAKQAAIQYRFAASQGCPFALINATSARCRYHDTTMLY